MKHIFFYFFIISSAIASIFTSCINNETAQKNEIIIDGRFIHSRANILHIDIIHVNNIEQADSVTLNEDGHFKFKYKTEKPIFFKIYTDNKNLITIIAEPGETIMLSGDINNLPLTYTVSGSPSSEIVAKYLENTQSKYKKFDSLSEIWENNKYSDNKMILRDSLDSLAKNIFDNQKKYTLDLINKNPNSLGSLFILYQYFGRSPVLDPVENIDVFEKISKTLSAKYIDFEHVGHLAAKVKNIKIAIKEEEEIKARLSIDKTAPDFSYEDKNNNLFKLSENKGHIVLLHFWASWSKESLRQIPTLRYYHKTYAPKGLKMISVSFDYDKEMWISTTDREKMIWTNICDFKYTSSPIAKLYNISKTPFLYLIDKEGKIKSKDSNIDIVGDEIYKLFNAR